MNKERIIEILKETKEIDGWTVIIRTSEKHNLYVTKKQEIEDVLSSERKDIIVTIRKKIDTSVGESTFPINTEDETVLRKQIADALVVCEYALNPWYNLPKKQHIKKIIDLVDSEITTEKVHQNIMKIYADVTNAFAKEKNVFLNGMEVLTNVHEVNIVNSYGIDVSQKKTVCYLETVITVRKGKEEWEFFPAKTACRLSDLDTKKFLKEYIKIAKDVSKSVHPENFNGNVLLSGDAITEFFAPMQTPNPLIMHASGRIKYMNLTHYEIGKKIAEEQGDTLTIATNPFIHFNIASSAFNEEGIISKKIVLIEKNVFKNYFATKQYADYLKIKPTGALCSIQVEKGTKKLKELRTEPTYEIVSFSSFVPNFVSGDFSAEIRLGYLHKDGKKIPLKGGMFTGNVFDLIKNCSLSKEVKKESGYVGPKGIVFREGVIAGL